jgi:hypothetical protein
VLNHQPFAPLRRHNLHRPQTCHLCPKLTRTYHPLPSFHQHSIWPITLSLPTSRNHNLGTPLIGPFILYPPITRRTHQVWLQIIPLCNPCLHQQPPLPLPGHCPQLLWTVLPTPIITGSFPWLHRHLYLPLRLPGHTIEIMFIAASLTALRDRPFI